MSAIDTIQNTNSQNFNEFIFIINNEQSFSRIFKKIPFPPVHFFTSPSDALYHILTKKEKDKNYSALIFCEQELEEIYATLIVSLLMLHPLGSLFPVIAIFDKIPNETDKVLLHQRLVEKENLKTLGAFDFLEFPYTVDKIIELAEQAFIKYTKENTNHIETLNAIQNANEEAKAHFQKAWNERIQNFEKNFVRFFYLPNDNASYEETYLIGKQKYYDRLFNQATVCFERSSEDSSLRKADSYMFLYAIQKEKLGYESSKNYLEKAISAFIEKKDWEKVQNSASLYAKDFPTEESPLYNCLQKEFSSENYLAVNEIINYNQKLLKMNKVAEILLKANRSTAFPPEMTAMFNKNIALKQIIYHSDLQDHIFDEQAYIQGQIREKTLQRLEQQKEARRRGEDPLLPKREVRSQEKIILNPNKIVSGDNLIDERKKVKVAPSLLSNIETEKKNSSANNQAEQIEKKTTNENNSQLKAKEKTSSQNSFVPAFGEENESSTVETVPTVYLEKNKSFINDIVNMAKFTRKVYKNK